MYGTTKIAKIKMKKIGERENERERGGKRWSERRRETRKVKCKDLTADFLKAVLLNYRMLPSSFRHEALHILQVIRSTKNLIDCLKKSNLEQKIKNINDEDKSHNLYEWLAKKRISIQCRKQQKTTTVENIYMCFIRQTFICCAV